MPFGEFLDLDQIGWLDFETRSEVPIKQGTLRYMSAADAIMLPHALGAGPVELVAVPDFRCPIAWAGMPNAFKMFHLRVVAGEAVWAAFNAQFDRAAWNYATLDFPFLEPWQIIDVGCQTAATGLPPDLEGVGQRLFRHGKDKEGKALIKLFCSPGATATPITHWQEWQRFGDYAVRDVELMREAWRHTKPLPVEEWRQYWAAEVISARGIGIDTERCSNAASLAQYDRAVIGAELDVLTGGAVTGVGQVAKITAWVMERLDDEGRRFLTKRIEVLDRDTGEVEMPAKHSLQRERVQALLTYLESQQLQLSEPEQEAQSVLALRLYGGSSTPAKFASMLAAHVDGVIANQYVFNGAGQSGRFSSRGVQVHNLNRSALPYEMDALDALGAGAEHSAFDRLGHVDDVMPVARKLSLLIRPMLVPEEGKVFCWSDWSQIEARILPWVALDPEAEERLDIFRACDADPELPDLYTRSAGDISHMQISEVIADTAAGGRVRQRGKVAELALGFAGGRGALQAMGVGYGLHISDEEAEVTVARWRAANAWAVRYWEALEEAASEARSRPGRAIPAGRVTYLYDRQYLGGTLFCELPSGRLITYARLKVDTVDIKDDDDNVIGQERQLRFSHGQGRAKLWRGVQVNNVVQGIAADVLRGTLVRLGEPHYHFMPVRLHTHDEILTEVDEARAETARTRLREVMTRGFDWSEGLPLQSEETIGRWYTKAKASTGL